MDERCTQRESNATELTVQIRRLIALLVKQHVRSWYSEISQDEQLFTHFDELTSQIHRTLSGRVETVDWHHFFIFQIPEILARHLEDFNLAKDRSRQSFPLETSFLQLQCHPGIENEGAYLNNVADAVLVVLLPENDLMSDLAYGFMRDLLADLVLRTVLERLSEPWFWDEVILKLQDHMRQRYIQNNWRITLRTYFDSLAGSLVSKLKRWFHFKPNKHTSSERNQGLSDLIQGLRTLISNPFHTWAHTSSLYSTAIPRILEEFLKPSDLPFIKVILHSILLPSTDLIAGETIMRGIGTNLEFSLSHASLANMTKLTRNVLFPDDEPSQNRVIPDTQEQSDLHLKVRSILPAGLNIPFFNSKIINKVLLFQILDSLMGTIFPELQRRSPEQLKQNVIRIRQANMEAAGNGGISTGRSLRMYAPMAPLDNVIVAVPSTAAARAAKNLRTFEADQHGIQALHAMKRSFELKRGKDLGFP